MERDVRGAGERGGEGIDVEEEEGREGVLMEGAGGGVTLEGTGKGNAEGGDKGVEFRRVGEGRDGVSIEGAGEGERLSRNEREGVEIEGVETERSKYQSGGGDGGGGPGLGWTPPIESRMRMRARLKT